MDLIKGNEIMSGYMKIPFFKPFIDEEDIKSVTSVLKSRWLTGGPKVQKFEKKFADYIGARYAIAVGNCTQALHLSMKVLDIGLGDEVIVPTFTFASTANCVLFIGAKPVLVDIDEKTFNISPESILEKITPKTKAIIPVHYAGQCCDMDEIMQIAKDYKLHIVEDCAHAIGSVYKRKRAGTFGITGCFSFYATKCMTTAEGGMVVTNNKKIGEKIKLLRSHCMTKSAYEREKEASWFYDIIDLGYNYRMSDIQAALGISQLRKIDKINNMRIQVAKYLTSKLKHIRGITPPRKAKHRNHIYHLYVIRVDEEVLDYTRDQIFEELVKRGISCSVHYTPLHRFSFYKRLFNFNLKDFPVAEKVYEQIISLPIYPQLQKTEIDYIVSSIKDIIES